MQIFDETDLGRAIRQTRKARGLTQETLAGLANVSTPFVIAVEAGKPRKQIGLVLRLIRALGLELTVTPRSPATTPHLPRAPEPNKAP